MRLWSPAIDLQSASARVIWMRLAALLLEASFELQQYTMPVTMTVGLEMKGSATKFWVDVGERDE